MSTIIQFKKQNITNTVETPWVPLPSHIHLPNYGENHYPAFLFFFFFKCGVLTTGLPEKSLACFFLLFNKSTF